MITRYECPIGPCEWTWDEPGALDVTADPYALMLQRAAGAESVIRAHLETHPLLEWAQEVMRLRGELDREKRDAGIVAASLLRRLGGSAFVSDTEMREPAGALKRMPAGNGIVLEVPA